MEHGVKISKFEIKNPKSSDTCPLTSDFRPLTSDLTLFTRCALPFAPCEFRHDDRLPPPEFYALARDIL
jgi:hypothetical protein